MELPKKMIATKLYGPNDLRLEEFDTPTPGPRDVIIKVEVNGICPSGKDAVRHGKSWGPPGMPGFPGHEFSGVVVAVGEKVTKVKVGDRVVAETQIRCGECYYCRIGKANLCMHRKGTSYFAYAEYLKTHESVTHKFPENVSFEAAAFTEPLACVLNGFEKLNMKAGGTTVIIGSGPMGLLHLQMTKNAGGNKVIISDFIEDRLKVAKKLGAHVTVNPKNEDLKTVVMAETDDIGADNVVVTVASVPAMEQALTIVRKGGTILYFAGVHSDEPVYVKIDPNIIHYGEVILTGSFDKTPEQFKRALDLIVNGTVNPEPLISHRLPLTKLMEGYDIVDRREGLKVMVYPHKRD